MTLEELIKYEKTIAKSALTGHACAEEVVKYLKELKTLRVELEKNSKELDVYKKALVQMADDYSFTNDGRALVLDYLQKAREHSDEKNILL